MNEQFIPVNTPLLSGNEKQYIMECIDTGWISSEGPYVSKFEDMLANYVDQKFGVAVSSGTAALEIAVKALGISDDDEVIMPAHTIISCAQAIVKQNAKPVLIDSELDFWNMDVSKIEEAITSKTKSIMVVHLYGFPVDMHPIVELADKYGLSIIEDTAQMLGQTYRGRKCGSFGDISTFSFYPNKQITTGEGGMCVTSSLELAEKCKELRNLCFGKKRFVHEELGWNYRMTNLQAALGVAQLEKIEDHVRRKREIGKFYTRLLSGNDFFELPALENEFSKNIFWVYGLILKENTKWKYADECMGALQKQGIGTRPFFFPMNKQPIFRNDALVSKNDMPNAEFLYEKGFYIPSGLGISNDQIEIVSDKINRIFN